MAQGNATLSGYAGTAVQINATAGTQSITYNYTDVSWNVKLVGQYAFSDSSSSYTNWNAQQNSGSSFTSGNYGYYRVQNTDSLTIASGTRRIYHNADGTKSVSFSGYASVYAGTATANTGTFALPTIPRYTTINSFTISDISDTSFKMNVTVANTCDLLEYSTNNGSSYSSSSGDFTSKSVTVTGLTADTSYNCKVRVRRKDSQLKTTSGTVTESTYDSFAWFIYDNGSPYADGVLKRDVGSGYTSVTGDLYFQTYSAEGATNVSHLSDDPSDILKSVLDYSELNGGLVSYDVDSIDDTGTSVSYEFKGQTCLEAIHSILTLAPVGWFWYIDTATNLLHFHEKGNTAEHTFAVGKDVTALSFDKRSEDIINFIYFTGGDVGGGSILYKKYENESSVSQYGIRAKRLIDGRVTDASTAETMANRILNTYTSPEIRLRVSVSADSSDTNGYDIESIRVGDVVRVANESNQTGSSLWNQMVWNVDKWNYDITQLGTMYLQIVRLEYKPDELVFTCSSIPPQVNKRIEDLERNLDAIQVADNEDLPT